MTPSVWRRGCPVALSSLRHVSLPYVGFDGRARRGALVVNASAAGDVVAAFRDLYRARFPIRRMQPDPGLRRRRLREHRGRQHLGLQLPPGDRDRAAGRSTPTASRSTSTRSRTPTSRAAAPRTRASVPYLDRSPYRAGMAVEGGALVAAFDARGWGWGGRWSGTSDFQHFSVERVLAGACRPAPLRLEPSRGGPRRRASTGSGRSWGSPAPSRPTPRRRPQAAAAAARRRTRTARDRRDLSLVTIDPPGSRDLDQALPIARARRRPPGALRDRRRRRAGRARRRRRPRGARPGRDHLHAGPAHARCTPTALGEGAASLLPDEDRPALLWTIDLDASGEPVGRGARAGDGAQPRGRSRTRRRRRRSTPGPPTSTLRAAARGGRAAPGARGRRGAA